MCGTQSRLSLRAPNMHVGAGQSYRHCIIEYAAKTSGFAVEALGKPPGRRSAENQSVSLRIAPREMIRFKFEEENGILREEKEIGLNSNGKDRILLAGTPSPTEPPLAIIRHWSYPIAPNSRSLVIVLSSGTSRPTPHCIVKACPGVPLVPDFLPWISQLAEHNRFLARAYDSIPKPYNFSAFLYKTRSARGIMSFSGRDPVSTRR